MKRKWLLLIVILLIGIISIITLSVKGNNPASKAVEIIENDLEDFGDDIDIEGVFYNKEYNVCIVGFYVGSKEEIAMVNLDN